MMSNMFSLCFGMVPAANVDLNWNAVAEWGTVRVLRQKFTLEDAIGSHACSLEANMRVTNGIPLGSPLLSSLQS